MNSSSKMRARGVTLFFMFYGVGGPLLAAVSYIDNPDTLYLIYICALVVCAAPFMFTVLEPVKK